MSVAVHPQGINARRVGRSGDGGFDLVESADGVSQTIGALPSGLQRHEDLETRLTSASSEVTEVRVVGQEDRNLKFG